MMGNIVLVGAGLFWVLCLLALPVTLAAMVYPFKPFSSRLGAAKGLGGVCAMFFISGVVFGALLPPTDPETVTSEAAAATNAIVPAAVLPIAPPLAPEPAPTRTQPIIRRGNVVSGGDDAGTQQFCAAVAGVSRALMSFRQQGLSQSVTMAMASELGRNAGADAGFVDEFLRQYVPRAFARPIVAAHQRDQVIQEFGRLADIECRMVLATR